VHIYEKIRSFFPEKLANTSKANEVDFTRVRKLTPVSLFYLILSLVGNNADKGIASKIVDFLRPSKYLDLNLDFNSLDKSALSKSRKKLKYSVFEEFFYKLADYSFKELSSSSKTKWNNLDVFAVDGSWYTLPASSELRMKFDENSGLENEGKGHYPKCLVTTIYDVYKRIVIARDISKNDSSERSIFKSLMHKVPKIESLIVFDRGYPSYEMLNLLNNDQRLFLFRCPVNSTFKSVQDVINADKKDVIVTIRDNKGNCLKVRVIVTKNNENQKIVFITNLLDKMKFKRNEIISLYFKRWEVETNFRNEKQSLNIETFHSKSYNGVMQELYAICILNLISRIISAKLVDEENIQKKEPQYKHSIVTIANNITAFLTKKIDFGLKIFKVMINEILSVLYYKEDKKNKSQPRVNKSANSKWHINRGRKLKMS